jgi:hypothetical protein
MGRRVVRWAGNDGRCSGEAEVWFVIKIGVGLLRLLAGVGAVR